MLSHCRLKIKTLWWQGFFFFFLKKRIGRFNLKTRWHSFLAPHINEIKTVSAHLHRCFCVCVFFSKYNLFLFNYTCSCSFTNAKELHQIKVSPSPLFFFFFALLSQSLHPSALVAMWDLQDGKILWRSAGVCWCGGRRLCLFRQICPNLWGQIGFSSKRAYFHVNPGKQVIGREATANLTRVSTSVKLRKCIIFIAKQWNISHGSFILKELELFVHVFGQKTFSTNYLFLNTIQ